MSEEENFTYYSEYKFCEEIAERLQGLLDLYNKEKENNKRINLFKFICRSYSFWSMGI